MCFRNEDIGKIDLSSIEAAAILLFVSILSQCAISDVAIIFTTLILSLFDSLTMKTWY
jgi:hypothetical protein